MALVSVGAGFGAVGNRTYRMEVIEMPLLPVDWLRELCRARIGIKLSVLGCKSRGFNVLNC